MRKTIGEPLPLLCYVGLAVLLPGIVKTSSPHFCRELQVDTYAGYIDRVHHDDALLKAEAFEAKYDTCYGMTGQNSRKMTFRYSSRTIPMNRYPRIMSTVYTEVKKKRLAKTSRL